MTTLVRKFFPVVQDIVQDRNPPFRAWPERMMVVATNFGLMALHKYLPRVSTKRFSFRLATGTNRQDITLIPIADIYPAVTYDHQCIAFVRALANAGPFGGTRGAAVRPPVDRDTLAAYDPLWQDAAGPEVREILFDKDLPTQFDVVPYLNTAQWLEIEAMVMPLPIPEGGLPGSEIYTEGGANAFALPLADNWVEDLTHYVCAYLLLKGGKTSVNVPKAQVHANAFLSMINAQTKAQTGVSANLKALPFLADEAAA